MAISTNVIFEIRTAGADTNGGGYVSGGTDMSVFDNKNSSGGTSCQSTTDNLSTADAVTNNTTTVTSATANFTAAIVGNLIYLSGTGTTTGWYQVASRTNATTIVVDRATGSTGGTGVTMNIGGALATLVPVFSATAVVYASNATVNAWMKSGTYTLTTTWTMNGNAAGSPCYLITGYTSARGDASTRPLITSATNSVVLITMNQGSSTTTFRNLSFSHTAGTRGIGITTTNSGAILRTERCKFDGCSNGINADNVGARSVLTGLSCIDTEITNSTLGGILIISVAFHSVGSWIHANTGYGVSSLGGCTAIIIQSIVNNNTSFGVGNGASTGFTAVIAIDSVFSANGGNGLTVTVTNHTLFSLISRNSIFYGNTGYGLSASATPLSYVLDHCAYGGNSTAALQNLTSGTGDVTLTGSPFTSTSDFSLNATAGAGAACKAVGFPGASIYGTGAIDIGPVQTAAGGGSTGGSYTWTA